MVRGLHAKGERVVFDVVCIFNSDWDFHCRPRIQYG